MNSRAVIRLQTEDILFHPVPHNGTAGETRVPLDTAAPVLERCTEAYRRAVTANRPDDLGAIGRELLGLFSGGEHLKAWKHRTGPRVLEIAVDTPDTDEARALLEAPWEVMADETGVLAQDKAQPFVVYRSIGRTLNGPPDAPQHGDLNALFMAAAPEGVTELDHELEEAAILGAVDGLDLRLTVEETGCTDFLKSRVSSDGPYEVFHVSCHGDIDDTTGPVLCLESPEGDPALVTAPDLLKPFGERKPALVFVSACRTAEHDRKAEQATEPFVRTLVRSGIGNVLGWDGLVYDGDARHFACGFYGELAGGNAVPYAAAVARQDLLTRHRSDPTQGRHWHLARVYLGSGGGGALSDPARDTHQLRAVDTGYVGFLDEKGEVPVASAQVFVGRRREAQAVLQAFRDAATAGVLIHGMGNLGKSSLAARITSRRPDLMPVVIFKRYDALTVFDHLVEALPPRDRAAWKEAWRETLSAGPASLLDALEDLLKGPFAKAPILLIVDDLERVLEPPDQSMTETPVRDASRPVLAAIITAFDRARKRRCPSRLLLTSRYTFTLPDGSGGDLAHRLTPVPLAPMTARQREKQWHAARTEAGPLPEDEASATRPDLLPRLLAAAGGNPGLQEVLSRPLLSGEPKAAEAAVAAVEHWRQTREVPEDGNRALDFFTRLSFETYAAALTKPQQAALRAATVFTEGLPIPHAAVIAAIRAGGVGDAEAAARRLMGLGLIDQISLRRHPHAAVNPLARPLAGPPLPDGDVAMLAQDVLQPLFDAWQTKDGNFPFDERGLEAARLALAAPNPVPALLAAAAYAAAKFLFNGRHDAKTALPLLQAALARLDGMNVGAASRSLARLFQVAANCAERLGETQARRDYLKRGIDCAEPGASEQTQMMGSLAEATQQDNPEAALKTLRQAVSSFDTLGDVRSKAVTLGKIADILFDRGQLDEALRIREQEERPVTERLGDQEGIASCLWGIAQIHLAREEFAEAAKLIPRAYDIVCRLGRLEGIAAIGVVQGQFLVASGRGEDGIAVLERSEQGFRQLGQDAAAEQVAGLIEEVRSAVSTQPSEQEPAS